MTTQAFPIESINACPICQHPEARFVAHYPEPHLEIGVTLNQCLSCSVVYQNPRLSLAGIHMLEDQSDVYDYDAAQQAQAVDDREEIIAWLETMTDLKPRSILDVGCNRGYLLAAAARRGWQPSGVELSLVSAAAARERFGFPIYPNLEALPEGQLFDLITCWHVVEHLHHPVQMLQQLYDLLTPDGVLAIQVPAYSFADEYLRRGNGLHIFCASHPVHYTAATLTMVLEKAGFEVLYSDESAEYLFLTIYAAKPTRNAQRRHNAELQAQLEQTSQKLAWFEADHAELAKQLQSMNQYIRRLEATLEIKNQYLEHLEQRLNAVNNGRAMRMLNKLKRT